MVNYQIATFEKVSFEQFKKDWNKYIQYPSQKTYSEYELRCIYDTIEIPKRNSRWSASYNIKALSKKIIIDSGIVPTGLRCKFSSGWALAIQSSNSALSTKNGLYVIDSDYNTENEGHICIPLYCVKDKQLGAVFKNITFCKGIFFPFGIVTNDNL